jgi:hypothetical protein
MTPCAHARKEVPAGLVHLSIKEVLCHRYRFRLRVWPADRKSVSL